MPRSLTPSQPLALGATVLVVGALVAGCSSSGSKGTTGGSTAGGAHVANVIISADKGCESDTLSLAAGGVTFKVQNKDATAVSEVELQSGERIVGEQENIPPGLGGSFSVNLTAGKYTLYCPGAKVENTTVTVTGKSASGADASTEALLKTGTAQYGSYVENQVAYLVTTTKALATALHGTDLKAAQTAYMKARPYYEKIEPVAESFTVGKLNLDAQIDERIADVPKGSTWTGFHRIEKGLFADKKLTGLAAFGDQLVGYVQQLQKKTTGLTYQPYELANGAQDLLNEVATSKITGEEEAYSLIDILDFEANDEGAEQAFAALQPALSKIDPTLTSTIAARFTALDTLVDTYRTGTNASGFVLYDKLTQTDKQKLAAAVEAVQAPLAQVAKKVATV